MPRLSPPFVEMNGSSLDFYFLEIRSKFFLLFYLFWIHPKKRVVESEVELG